MARINSFYSGCSLDWFVFLSRVMLVGVIHLLYLYQAYAIPGIITMRHGCVSRSQYDDKRMNSPHQNESVERTRHE